MVVTLLANAGHIFKEELTYAMLYTMLEKINSDLQGTLQDEKDDLQKIFEQCENKKVPVERAMIKYTHRITSYTNTALFHSRQHSA